MPSRTVLSTSCSSPIASATGIFKAGSVRSDPDRSLPRPAKLFDPGTVSHHRLRVRPKETTAYADNAATEFVTREGSSAGMPGEMSQMIAVRPNAGAVRHQDRCGVVRLPRGGGFVPIVAHGITPNDVAAGSWKCPHGVSPLSPDERLLARLGFLWLACPSYPEWEAASRPVPPSACALSSAEWMWLFPRQCCGGARPSSSQHSAAAARHARGIPASRPVSS